MKNQTIIDRGDRVRIEIIVNQVSVYGFSVIKFKLGGSYPPVKA